jgi:hypothetical protein
MMYWLTEPLPELPRSSRERFHPYWTLHAAKVLGAVVTYSPQYGRAMD